MSAATTKPDLRLPKAKRRFLLTGFHVEVPIHERFETRIVTRQSHLDQCLIVNGSQDGVGCGAYHSDCGDPFCSTIVWRSMKLFPNKKHPAALLTSDGRVRITRQQGASHRLRAARRPRLCKARGQHHDRFVSRAASRSSSNAQGAGLPATHAGLIGSCLYRYVRPGRLDRSSQIRQATQ